MALTDKLTAIANSIRDKKGCTEPLTLNQMAEEISSIKTDPVLQPITITENGTYEAPEGVDGYNPVTVDVAASGGDDGSFKAVIERTATEITLPNDLTKIGTYAFCEFLNLALTSLPDGVTSIEGQAFRDCYKLALTSLPDGVTSIGSNAFRNCSNLTKLTFNGKPSSIASTAFDGCTNLLTINVPWAEGAVSGAPWGATNATINYNYTGG